MKFINVMVEGQTEYDFVDIVLRDYFNPKGLHLTPIILTTKRVKRGANFKGGVTSYGKAKYDIEQKLKDKNAVLLTTMIDFYGLPTDFPNYQNQPKDGTCYDKATFLENAFKADINHPRFLPYLMIHEFEAMLFTSPQAIVDGLIQPEKLSVVTKIRDEFDSPEEINTQRPPSKRLSELFPAYDKRADGTLIADEIGVDDIRQVCPHFDAWLTELESVLD